MSTNNVRKTILVLIVIAVIGAVWFFFGQNHEFRLVRSTPDTNQVVATSTSTVRLEFSEDLDTSIDYAKNIEGDFIVSRTFAEGPYLFLTLRRLEKDTAYSFVVKNVVSLDQEIIDEVRVSFTAGYIQFERLSGTQKELEAYVADRGRFDNPILNILPHQGDRFFIKYTFGTDDMGESILFLDVDLYVTREDLGRDKNEIIAQYGKRVTDYISGAGINPDDYTIRYTVIEPPTLPTQL